MYLEHYRLKLDPFSPSPDSRFFFPGGGRGKLLQHVLEDLNSGMSLVHLSGEEGSGKTLLCQLILDKIQPPKTVVLLSKPSGTFDEIARSLALALGEKDIQLLAGVKLYNKILCLLSTQADKGGSTLFIIDDVEKLNPPALKRILRLAYDAQPQGRVQFVLSGRLALGSNPEQFTSIRSEPLQQFTYTLQPLGRDDTASYLAFRLAVAGMPDDKQDGVFSSEAVTRIHETTCGNIRFINILAKEALRNSCKSKSFMILPDHVKAPTDLSPENLSHHFKPRWKTQSGIIALIIVASIFIFDMVLKDISPKQPDNDPQHAMQEALLSPEKELPVPQQTLAVTSPPPVVAPPLTATPPPTPKPSIQASTQPASQEISSSPAEKLPVPEQTLAVTSPPPVVAPPLTPIPPPNPKPTIQVATQPASQEATPTLITARERNKKQLSGSKIFDKRKQATQAWTSRELRGRYTIQILMTNAPAAEKQIYNTLEDEVFLKAQNDIYILHKNFNRPAIIVFHGIYNSMQEARQARDKLPTSMKKYNPFPLVIADAIK